MPGSVTGKQSHSNQGGLNAWEGFMWQILCCGEKAPEYIYSDYIPLCNTSSYICVCQFVTWAHKCHPVLYRTLILPPFTHSVIHSTWLSVLFLLLTFFCQLLAIHRPFSPSPTTSYLPWSDFFPFLDFDIYKTKISHSIITSNCGFSPSSSFKSRKRDMEDLQSSMGRQYGHPSCLSRRQNVVLTNPQMYLVFFSLSRESFSLLIVISFPVWKCSFVAGRALTACLSLNSLRALGLSQTPFSSFFLFFLLCLPFFTLVMSRLLPLSRLQHWNPRREEGQEGA